MKLCWQEHEHVSNKATTSKWKMTSSAEKRNKGKAPAQGYSQDKRLPAGQFFVMHEGASSKRNPRGSISLQEFLLVEVTYSSGDMLLFYRKFYPKPDNSMMEYMKTYLTPLNLS